MAGTSTMNGRPAKSTVTERVFFWVLIAGLAWCPFLYGSNVLLAWGVNALLFPGLVIIFELSLLIRGERHPVAIRQLKVPAALFAAVVLWILIQNATWTPDWLHHPIWQMTADALDKPVAGSISVNRELTSLALLRLVTAAGAFWIAVQLCRDRGGPFIAVVHCNYHLRLRWLWPFCLCADIGAISRQLNFHQPKLFRGVCGRGCRRRSVACY